MLGNDGDVWHRPVGGRLDRLKMIVTHPPRTNAADAPWQAWPTPTTNSEKRRVDRIRIGVSLGLMLIWWLANVI